MEQLKQLYNLILIEKQSTCVRSTVELLENSQHLQSVKQVLKLLGYQIDNLNIKTLSALFFALVDLVFVVEKDDFYIATLNPEQVLALMQGKRILGRDDESNFEKTNNTLENQTLEVINEYLGKGKLHFIKLKPDSYTCFTSFYVRVSGMSPYPDLKKSDVYPLSEVGMRYTNIANKLLTGFHTITTEKESIVCTTAVRLTKGKELNKTCTSGSILAKTQDDVLVQLPIWGIKNIERFVESKLVSDLLEGIYKYKVKEKSYLITLNKEHLLRYYGKDFYRLESLGVRQRYALEEMISLGGEVDINYYYKKYNFYTEKSMLGISNFLELRKYLTEQVLNHDKKEYNSSVIHPRVLCSTKAIASKYIPYYMTISLNDSIELEKVNAEDVMPKRYRFSAISKDWGYGFVEIYATSDSLANTYGKEEFTRQFGSCLKVISIYNASTNSFIKGTCDLDISISEQKRLGESLMSGNYSNNYKDYSLILRGIIATKDIDFKVSDEHIKYLFVNSLARKCKLTDSLTLSDLADSLIEFITLLKSGEGTTDKALNEQYIGLAKNGVVKDFKLVKDTLESTETSLALQHLAKLFKVNPLGNYYEVVSKNGIMRINIVKGTAKLSSEIRLLHQGKEIGKARL